MRVLTSATFIVVLSLPAFAQEAPAARERIVPPAVALEAKPETPRASPEIALRCQRDPEGEKAGNADRTCVEIKNPPPAEGRHPDYGKPKQYPLSPA